MSSSLKNRDICVDLELDDTADRYTTGIMYRVSISIGLLRFHSRWYTKKANAQRVLNIVRKRLNV